MMRTTPSMSEPIDIRASLDRSPAQLVSEQFIEGWPAQLVSGQCIEGGGGRVRGDYELSDGRKIFTLAEGDEVNPSRLDNSTGIAFHEYRLMFLEETDEYVTFAESGSESDHDPDVDLLIGIARIDYGPNGEQKETMLDVQSRSRINDSPRLPPIDFGSLDPAYDDLVGDRVEYGDCNYTYLLEG